MSRDGERLRHLLETVGAVFLVTPDGALPPELPLVDSRARLRKTLDLTDLATRERARLEPDSTVAAPPLLVRGAERAPELVAAAARKARRPGDFLLVGAVPPRLATSGLAVGSWLPGPGRPRIRLEELAGTDAAGVVRKLAGIRAEAHDRGAAASGLLPEDALPGGPDALAARILEHVAVALRTERRGALDRLARALLAGSGAPLALAAAARAAAVPFETARRFLAGFEAACLVERLPPHARSGVRSPVLLPVYASVAAARGKLTGGVLGRLSALLELSRGASPDLALAHWATHAGARVELVVTHREACLGVALRDRLPRDARALRGLRGFLDAVPRAVVLLLAEQELADGGMAARVLADGIVAAPLALLATGGARPPASSRPRIDADERDGAPGSSLPTELL